MLFAHLVYSTTMAILVPIMLVLKFYIDLTMIDEESGGRVDGKM
jgi:hypothetical protein